MEKGEGPDCPVLNGTREEILAYLTAMEQAYLGLMATVAPSEMRPEVELHIETITGVDGNTIELYVFQRRDRGNAIQPAVLYFHGSFLLPMGPNAWAKVSARKKSRGRLFFPLA